MSVNNILGIILVLLILTFFSCMIAGDAFISKIAFSSTEMTCDSFADIPTTVPNTAPTTAPTTASTTVPSQSSIPNTTSALPVLYNNPTCVTMDSVQMGFVKFRMVINWIIFILLSGAMGYGSILLVSYGWIGIVFLLLGLLLWVFMLVGNIFLSQFAFESSAKTCDGKSSYCYGLNEHKIVFAKMASIFSFLITFVVFGVLGFLLFKSV